MSMLFGDVASTLAVTDADPEPQSLQASKIGGLCPLLGEGRWVPIYHSVAWAEAYLHTKWHLDPSSRLATIDMVRKLGALHPFGGRGSSLFGRGELGPHLIQCGHGRGLSACQVSS